MVILAEEVGEAAEQSLKAHFTADAGATPLSSYRAEMVQVAAVAVAAIESLDRALSPKEEA